jgi:hypothetical protein
MEISSARSPTAEDHPRKMHRRSPGTPDLAGDQLMRTEEDTMDQPDAVCSHNREAWDAQVERGNRWTVPVDHQAIEAARRGRLEVLLTDSRAVPAAWFPNLSGFSGHQLAVLPGTAHFIPPGSGVMDRAEWLLAMVAAYLDAPTPEAEPSAGGGA